MEWLLDLNWHWPWVFILLPLPLIVRFLLPARQSQQAALKVAHLSHWKIEHSQTHTLENPQFHSRDLVIIAIWLLLLIALARPYQLGETVNLPISGRDLLLAVDLSQSMEIEDMQLNNRAANRLAAVKHIVSDFIEQRVGDRLGLILFGSEAYLQAPLTFDRKTVKNLLLESQIGLAGPKTAIGDAIGLAVKRLQKQPENSRVLVLITDGANTSGELEPLKAADLAALNSIKIYTIGLGANAMEVASFFGSRTIDPSRDMDEDALREIAKRTGGQYFRAHNTQELHSIYRLLDVLEPTEQDAESFRPQKNYWHWPLLLAFILSTALALLQSGILNRKELQRV